MDTNINTSSYQPSTVSTPQSTKATRSSVLGLPNNQDSISTSESTAFTTYTSRAHAPQLPSGTHELSGNLEDYFINRGPTDQEITAELETLFEDEMDKIFKDRKLEKEKKSEIISAYKFGLEGEIKDKQLNQAYDSSLKNAKKSLKNKFPNISEPYPRNTEENIDLYHSQTRKEIKNILTQKGYIDSKGNLSEEGIKLYNSIQGGWYASDSEAIEVMKQVDQSMALKFGKTLPLRTNTRLLSDVGTAYQDLVLGAAPKGQEGKFEALFHYPDPQDPLQAEVDKAQTNAFAGLQKQYGFPDGFTIPQTSAAYDAKLSGTFYSALEDSINANPLLKNSGDTQVVKDYIKAMLNGTESEFALKNQKTELIKSLAAKHYKAAMDVVGKTYALSGTWKPDATRSIDDYVGGIAAPIINNLKSLQGALQTTINDSSISGKDRVMLKDYLRIVSQALTELNELMYIMQTKESESARGASDMKLSLIEDQRAKQKTLLQKNAERMEEQKEAREKTREAQKEQERKAEVMKYLGPILMATSIALAAVAGPAMFAVAIAITILTTVPIGEDKDGNSKTIMGTVMGALMKEIDKISDGPGGIGLELSLKIGLIVMLAGATIASGSVIGATIGLTLISSSGLIEASVKDIAIEAKGEQWVKENPDYVMGWTVGTTLLVTLLTIGATTAVGAKKAANTAKTAAQIGKQTADAANKTTWQTIKQTIQKPWNNIGSKYRSVAEGLSIGAESANAAGQIYYHQKMANINYELAKLNDKLAELIEQIAPDQAEIEYIQELKELLTKFIEKLQQSMTDMGDFMEVVQEHLPKTYGTAADATTEGWGAIAG